MCCHLKGNADTEDKNGQRCVPPLLVASAQPTRHHFNVIKEYRRTEIQKYKIFATATSCIGPNRQHIIAKLYRLTF